jgi:hypothetical protein
MTPAMVMAMKRNWLAHAEMVSSTVRRG